MNRVWTTAVVVSGALALLQFSAGPDTSSYRPALSGPDRLLTNEYAHANPNDTEAVRSADWDVTSGSLFLREGAGWTGPPDAVNPDRRSVNGTGSSVFRVTTRRSDFLNTLVTLRVRNRGLTSRGRSAPADLDGIHVFLRWQSPEDLYVVSLNRRDDLIVIKRKSPGGPVNGGTYRTLGQADYPVPYGRWQTFQMWTENTGENAATISIGDGVRTLLSVTDTGDEVPPILAAGATGLRGDNCDFEFDSFRVRSIG